MDYAARHISLLSILRLETNEEMVKDQQKATLVSVGSQEKEVLEELVYNPLLKDKQIAFEDASETQAPQPPKQENDQ